MTRVENMMSADEPVFFCMADSTNKLCEIRHIVARMVISRMLMDKDAMIAMGAYSVRKVLEMNTIAASPGSPTNENRGDSHDAI